MNKFKSFLANKKTGFYVSAVEVFHSSEVVAGEPDSFYDETWHMALGGVCRSKEALLP